MSRAAGAGAVAAMLLLLAWALRQDGGLPTEGPPSRASPETGGIGGAALPPGPSPDPKPATDPVPGPNIAGEVTDRNGRLLEGEKVIVVAPDHRILCRAETDGRGRFAMGIDAELPFCVRIDPGEDASRPYDPDLRIQRLPCLDLILIRSDPPGEAMLSVRAEPDFWPGDQAVRLRLYDATGQVKLLRHLDLADSPWTFDRVSFGRYDVRLDGVGIAGALREFDFGPDRGTAAVPMHRSCRIRASPTSDVRVTLVTGTPPLPRGILDDDLVGGYVRCLWASDKVEGGGELDLENLPAGEYVLRFFGEGVESMELAITLGPGEVKDLGEIELRPATGALHLEIRDREDEGLEFPYLVRLYADTGLFLRRKLGPGANRVAVFKGLSEGVWRYRVERLLSGESHKRSVGHDRAIRIERGQTVAEMVDCTWRY